MTRSWRIPFTNKHIRWVVYERSEKACREYENVFPEAKSTGTLTQVRVFTNTAGRRLA